MWMSRPGRGLRSETTRMKDLCARNLSAAIRETMNAKLAAITEGIDDLSRDLIDRALELLERTSAKISSESQESQRPAPVAAFPRCSNCGEHVPKGYSVCNGDGSHPVMPEFCDLCKGAASDLCRGDASLTQVPHIAISDGLLIFGQDKNVYLWLCLACRTSMPASTAPPLPPGALRQLTLPSKPPKKKKQIPFPKPPVSRLTTG